ncbi:MAG: helix-turn-helix domain-containing protein [Chitinophagaceae bacterium]
MTNFLNTIILLAAIQGFIVSILLFRRKGNKQPDRLLGVLILLMSTCSINLYISNTHLTDGNTVLTIISYLVPLVVVMPMGPLIYFYIKSVLDPSFKLTRKHRFHFYTVIIDIVPELTTIIFICGVYLGLLLPKAEPWGIFIDTYNIYADVPRWASLTLYVWLSYKYIKRLKAADPTMEKKSLAKLKWLQQFIGVFLVFQTLWFIYLIPYVNPAYTQRLLDLVDWYPLYIPMAIMIYWLGIKGYMLGPTFIDSEKKKKVISQEFSETVIQQTTASLKKAMEEDKLYLNPALNLEGVAAATGISPKTISAVLNQHLQTSFNEWLNGYRVEEFKQKIRQADLQQLTISAVAFECGFNSQATFQRIFKQNLGMTPSEYLKIPV